jgi:hypothetical protein
LASISARIARIVLFVPGDRLEQFDKAAPSGAEEIIFDLEAERHRSPARVGGGDSAR